MKSHPLLKKLLNSTLQDWDVLDDSSWSISRAMSCLPHWGRESSAQLEHSGAGKGHRDTRLHVLQLLPYKRIRVGKGHCFLLGSEP